MARIRAVFFDVGETLVNETSMWEWRADDWGIPKFTFMAVFGSLIERGEDHRKVYEIFDVKPGGRWPGFGLEDFYPDAVPCLRTLKASGYRIGLVGNTTEQIEDTLRTLDLPADVIGSSARWGIEKPSPAFFERVVRESGFAPDEVVYVGDRLDNDVLPAVDAGMVGVFIRRGPWGIVHAQRPEVSRATYRIESLDELLQLLLDHA